MSPLVRAEGCCLWQILYCEEVYCMVKGHIQERMYASQEVQSCDCDFGQCGPLGLLVIRSRGERSRRGDRKLWWPMSMNGDSLLGDRFQ